MANTATDANTQPAPGRVKFPLLFRLLVCLGWCSGGAYFGSVHGTLGIVLGAVGGFLVAVFWLDWIARVYRQHVIFRIIEGCGTGIVAGMICVVWIHTMAWFLGCHVFLSKQPHAFLEGNPLIECIGAGILGGLYGLVCMGFGGAYLGREQRNKTS